VAGSRVRYQGVIVCGQCVCHCEVHTHIDALIPRNKQDVGRTLRCVRAIPTGRGDLFVVGDGGRVQNA
jgi:hypothetical protein